MSEFDERESSAAVQRDSMAARDSLQYPDDAALIGTIVGERYLVHGLLGSGGMGTVFEVEHVQLRKRMALKVLHSHMSAKPEVQARFEREAVAAGRISHPGVVTATDFGRLPDGSFYLALEHVDGRSLAEVIEAEGPLTADRAFALGYQINAALRAAHEAGVVHRDLKPDNIMVVDAGDDEVVKVLDFGIAKMAQDEFSQSERPLTKVGLVFGTPDYMSPEQAKGAPVDHRTDLYSLGMIFYEMLTGASAFHGPDLMAILTAQMADPPPPLPAGVPPAFAALVLQLLEKEPDARPSSADVCAGQLVEISMTEGLSIPTPRTQAGRLSMGSTSYQPDKVGAGVALRNLSMRPIGVGKKKLPLIVPVGALLLGLSIGGAAMLHETGGLSHPVGQPAAPSAEALEAQLLSEARAGSRDALSELRKLAEEERARLKQTPPAEGPAAGEIQPSKDAGADDPQGRQAARFLALGRGYSIIHHFPAALGAYKDAVLIDPHLAEDGELLLDVRQGLIERDAVEDGLDFALHHLGAHGADLIYDVWLNQKGKAGMTPVVVRAMKIVKGDDLRDHATEALKIAMDLESAQVCAEFRALLPRAVAHADSRSTPVLKALGLRRGCGHNAKKDCYVCLREHEAALAQALEASESRPSPSFLRASEAEILP